VKCEIVPHKGLDVASFGEERNLVRDRLGSFVSFRRTPGGPLVDHHAVIGVIMNYDDDDRLELIELTPPADVTFQGVPLLRRRHQQVVNQLQAQGVSGKRSETGTTFAEQGFALYVPVPDDPDEDVQAVVVFPRGNG
jgi:hypothetical protein